jgi:hypothetical protein
VIDSREEQQRNAFVSMRVNSESVSNEIDESINNMKSMMNKEFEHDEA